jgi:hypothetical protein
VRLRIFGGGRNEMRVVLEREDDRPDRMTMGPDDGISF